MRDAKKALKLNKTMGKEEEENRKKFIKLRVKNSEARAKEASRLAKLRKQEVKWTH